MISASEEVGVSVMMELCQRVLDGKEMPNQWQTTVLVPIFKEKGDVKKLLFLQNRKAVRTCHEDR